MTNNPNTSQSWEQFYNSTQSLTQANAAHQMFNDDDILELNELVKDVFIKFLELGQLNQGIKIYVNRELDNGIIEEMAKRPPLKEETLEDWCKVIFGDRRFGIVFNSLESYSNEMTEKMVTIVTPMLKKAGIPLGGLSFLFFIGNYGFTPFGIHKEAKGEEGFLFHLGPASKEFFTWDHEELNKIEHNAKVFHEVEEMLPKAKCYNLHPKSVMFIPHHLYHIGNTDEFSVSIVMDYINPSVAFLEKTIAKEIAEQEVEISSDHKYLKAVQYDSTNFNWKDFIDLSSWERNYKYALNRRILRLKSNGGVLKKSITNVTKEFPIGDFSISAKSMFPLIVYTDQNKRAFILARGHDISVKNNPSLTNVLERLNEGEELNMKELETRLMPDWDLIEIFGVIGRLDTINAIEISKL